MTARTRSPHGRPAKGRRAPAKDRPKAEPVEQVARLGWPSIPGRLRVAFGVAALAAGFAVVGIVLGPVADVGGPAFGSSPLLIVLAIAPVVVAAVCVGAGRAPVGAGVLTGAGLVAPARVLLDLQLVRDPVEASRPELLVPTNLGALDPAAGVWLLLAGHVAAAGAGLLAAGRAGAKSAAQAASDAADADVTAAAEAAKAKPKAPKTKAAKRQTGTTKKAQVVLPPPNDYAAGLDTSVSSVAARGRAMGWALAFATAAVAGLLLPPYRSDNAFVLATDLIGSPTLVRIGGVVLALTIILGGVLAAGTSRPPLAKGMVLGLAVALAGVTLPPLVAGFAVDWLHPERWAYLALLPLPVLALMIFFMPSLTSADTAADAAEAELRLEANRLHLVTGVLGVLVGVAALGGMLTPLLVVDAGLDRPANYASRQFLPAGVLLIVLGAALCTRWAAVVRPAFIVALGSVALVGTAALDAAFTGDSASTAVHLGAGVWFAGAAIVLGLFAAVAGAIAGGAERDDVDLTERVANISLAVPLGLAVALAVGAFGLPVIRAEGFVAPGIWTEFRLTSWGLVTALVAVAVAAVVAVSARPSRAAALLLGAAAVVGVHLLELPLTAGRAEGATAAAGTWLSLACAVVLVVSVVPALVARPKRRTTT